MPRNTWFETVAIAQQRAKKRLPKSVYSSLISASEKGLTVADNVESFGELGFAPHVIGAPELEGFSGVAPPEVSAAFAARVLGVGLAVWALMGWVVGFVWAKGADTTA